MKVNFLFVVLNRVKNNQIIKFTRLHFFNFKKYDLHISVIILKFNSHTEKLQARITVIIVVQIKTYETFYLNRNLISIHVKGIYSHFYINLKLYFDDFFFTTFHLQWLFC